MKNLLGIAAAVALALVATTSMAETKISIVSGQEKQSGDILRQVFEGFDAANDDVTIEFRLDNKSDLETAQMVMADIIAGSPPDAVRVTGAIFSTLVNSGRAQPLDDCLDSQPELMAELDQGLLDNFRGADGKLYAMPFYTTLPSLYINVPAFKAAGLDPNDPPATWSELEAAAAKLSNKDAGQFGILMYMPNTYLFEAQMESAGGSWVDGDGNPTFNNEGAIASLEYMRGLVEKGYMPAIAPSAFWGQFVSIFRSGDLKMLVSSSSSFPSLSGGLDFEMTMVPMPIADSGSMMANASANGFVMMATDPEKQKATCAALSSLVSAENVTAIVKATATVPHNRKAATSDEYLASFYAENPAFVAINAQNSDAWYAMPGRQNNEFQSVFADIQFQVLSGDISVEEGVAKMQQAMVELLADR